MERPQIKKMIEQLLGEIEEEDIGISLFSTYYQVQEELHFFNETDRRRVLVILKKLAEDSQRHKKMLERIIERLGGWLHEK